MWCRGHTTSQRLYVVRGRSLIWKKSETRYETKMFKLKTLCFISTSFQGEERAMNWQVARLVFSRDSQDRIRLRAQIYHNSKGVPKHFFERSRSINPDWVQARTPGPPLGMLANNPSSHSRPILAHSSILWLRMSPPRTDMWDVWWFHANDAVSSSRNFSREICLAKKKTVSLIPLSFLFFFLFVFTETTV